jgi:hypothetical protein
MHVAPGRLLEGPIQIEPPDRECPCDGDRMECLGWQVGLPSIVLTPFAGAFLTRVLGVAWCPQTPLWISSSSRFPCSMGMQCCRILVWLRL